jgi:hypothetical protein
MELARSWALPAFVVVLIGIFVGIGMVRTRTPVVVEATVVRFGSQATNEGNQPILVVRLEDGTVQELLARPSDVKSCRAGGLVRLDRRGALLFVRPGGCLPR